MKVAVVGSRSVDDSHYLTLCETMPIGASTIISGGAKGADALAKRYAAESNLYYEEYIPEYERYGRGCAHASQPADCRPRRLRNRNVGGKSQGAAYIIQYCMESGTPCAVLICH